MRAWRGMHPGSWLLCDQPGFHPKRSRPCQPFRRRPATRSTPKECAMTITVVCIAPSEFAAHGIIEALRDSGIPKGDVSVLFSGSTTTMGYAHEMHTKAPEGATAGGTSGAVIGGVLGWLVGIGALAIPGVGPFLAAGPIMAALAGVGVGAAVGGITGALVGFGVPEFEARRYETRLRKGGILLSVHADNHDWIARAKAILEKTGAEEISSASESRVA